MVRVGVTLFWKFSILGALAVGVISPIETLGIPPAWQLLFNGIVIGWLLHSFLSSYVGGQVKPDKQSSRAYVHYFNSCHLFFQRSDAYFMPWKRFNASETDEKD